MHIIYVCIATQVRLNLKGIVKAQHIVDSWHDHVLDHLVLRMGKVPITRLLVRENDSKSVCETFVEALWRLVCSAVEANIARDQLLVQDVLQCCKDGINLILAHGGLEFHNDNVLIRHSIELTMLIKLTAEREREMKISRRCCISNSEVNDFLKTTNYGKNRSIRRSRCRLVLTHQLR